MLLKTFEWEILRNLLGKKAEAIIIPNSSDSISAPVEAALALADHHFLIIDSCFRTKKPTEIANDYPQLRIRLTDSLPSDYEQQRIPLGKNGEIIRRIQLVNEVFRSQKANVEYTRAIHFQFTDSAECTFMRESYRVPSIQIIMDSDWKDRLGRSIDFRQIINL